jgi:hypothetical protein
MSSVKYVPGLPLYFFHIPKTGGMTMQALIEEHYAPEKICPVQLEPQFEQLPDDSLDQYELFAGHMWGVKKRLQRPVNMFTILRDPFKRAVSMYYYILRVPGHAMHEAANQGEFERVVTHPSMNNSQVVHLARCATAYHKGMPDDEVFDLAIEQLDSCFFVGFTEHLDATAKRLFELLDYPPLAEVPFINTRKESGQQDVLDAAQLERISEVVDQDRKLYAYGMDKFGGFWD